MSKDRWASKVDVIGGGIMMGVVAFFIIVACGTTLFLRIQINTAEDAALSLKPLAGKYDISYLPSAWRMLRFFQPVSYPLPQHIIYVRPWAGKQELENVLKMRRNLI